MVRPRAVIGEIGTGKSRLAHMLAWEARRAGHAVLVCEPEGDCGTWIGAHRLLHDAPETVAWMKANPQAAGGEAFFEEAAEVCGGTGSALAARVAFAARGCRKYGWRSTFIWQRWPELSASLRRHCQTVVAFAQDAEDAEMMARDLRAPELLECIGLPDGQAVIWQKGRPGTTRLQLPQEYDATRGW